MSEVICPFCGTANPPLESVCKLCHKPLFAELPHKPASPESGELDWLSQLRGEEDDQAGQQDHLAGRRYSSASQQPEEEEIPEWLERIRRRTMEDRLAREGQLNNLEGAQEPPPPELPTDEDEFSRLFDVGADAQADASAPEPDQEIPTTAKEDSLSPANKNEEFGEDIGSFKLQGEKPSASEEIFSWLEGLTTEESRENRDFIPLDFPPEFQMEETESQTASEDLTTKEIDSEKSPESLESSGMEGFRTEFTDWVEDIPIKPEGENGANEPGGISPETPEHETGLAEELGMVQFETEESGSDHAQEEPAANEIKLSEDGVKQEAEIQPARLPGWLEAIKPIESVAPLHVSTEVDRRTESTGPLAGFQGVIPAVPQTPSYSKPAQQALKIQFSEKQRVYASLLENLVADEAKPLPRKTVEMTAPSGILRFVVGLLLIGLLTFVLAGGSQFGALPGLFPPETVAFFDTLQQFSQVKDVHARILIAVDYEPGLSGEMQTIASYPVRQLLEGGAYLALVSTNPSGPALGQQLIKIATSDLAQFQADGQVINLGYLVGGSTSLANLAAQPSVASISSLDGQLAWESPLLQGIQSMADFDGLMVLTDNPDNARAWIEQVQASLSGRPLLIVSSAQAAPMIIPYYQSNQIQGLVAGLSGSATYEQLTQGNSSPIRKYWDAYQAGILLIIIAILIGAMACSIQGIIRSRRMRKRI